MYYDLLKLYLLRFLFLIMKSNPHFHTVCGLHFSCNNFYLLSVITSLYSSLVAESTVPILDSDCLTTNEGIHRKRMHAHNSA